jgi:hypothetical protein
LTWGIANRTLTWSAHSRQRAGTHEVIDVRHKLIASVLALTFALASSGVAAAATASINPSSQSHSHGSPSSWTLSWGGQTPFRTVCFYYDKNNAAEGGWCLLNTNLIGATDSHTFTPCSTKTFYQVLNVTDWGNNFVTRQSSATESGGAC